MSSTAVIAGGAPSTAIVGDPGAAGPSALQLGQNIQAGLQQGSGTAIGPALQKMMQHFSDLATGASNISTAHFTTDRNARRALMRLATGHDS